MPDIILAILLVTVLLALSSLILPLADRLALPFTTLLALFGLGLGSLVGALGHIGTEGIVTDLIDGISNFGLSADAFLFLFLPPLLFTAGLTMDVRLLFDELGAVLLLAVIAVVVTTAAVGFALNAVSGVALIPCLLLGAIVATTDPSAVISIFRDLGAPRRLTTLVAGESVFNDAAAIAIFALLLEALQGEHDLSLIGGIRIFVIDFAGGLALGYILARLAGVLLQHVRNSPAAEITLTVSLAYLTFILGEIYLNISGVVAVVSAALTFAVYGRARVRSETWGPLIQIWQQLDFWANSLIFVLAAILAARFTPALNQIGYLAVLIIAAMAGRALVLYGFLPALSALRLTQPVGHRYRATILWGGLRGAVTMVLALAVIQNPAVPAGIDHFVAVLAIGYVLFTLFVAAPTLRPFMRMLHLDRLDTVEIALRDRAMALSDIAIRQQVAEVARDYGFDPALADRVSPETPSEDEAPVAATPEVLSDETRLNVGLLTLANHERELFLEHMAQGTMSRPRVANRVAAAERTIDRVKAAGAAGYEESGKIDVRLSIMFRIALRLNRHFGWTGPLGRVLADRFETLLVTELAIRELRRFNRRSIRPLLGERTSAALGELLNKRFKMLEDALAAIELQYPSFAEALRAQYLARARLRFEDVTYRRQLDESLITREVFNHLQRDLESRRQEIERQPPLDLGLGLADMMHRVKVFQDLDRNRLVYIARLLRPRLAMPGERIVRKGATGRAMYFIASGRVRVSLPNGSVELGPGDFFGELALLSQRPRNADVTAISYCHLLVLDRRDFRRLLRRDKALEHSIRDVADQRLQENHKLDST